MIRFSKNGIVERDWLFEFAKAFWMHLNTTTPPSPSIKRKDTKDFGSFRLFHFLKLVNFVEYSIFLWSSFSSFWGWVGIFCLRSLMYCGNGRYDPFHDFKILQYNWNNIGVFSFWWPCLLIFVSYRPSPYKIYVIGAVLDTFKPHY